MVDVFAGAGGMSLGFEQAGFDVKVAVELDPVHAAIHQLNFPRCKVLCRDVRKISGQDIRTLGGFGPKTIDVVVGGPPCQGFSQMGKRESRDSRNLLVFEFLRLVTELKPRVFVMENVTGFASGTHAQLLGELIRGFQETDYIVRLPYKILNAMNYGVPQDRKRLFLLGARRNRHLPQYPETLTSHSILDPSIGVSMRDHPIAPTVADAITDLPNVDDYKKLFEVDELHVRLRGGSRYAKILREDIREEDDFSYPRVYDKDLLTGCLRTRHTRRSQQRFARTSPESTERISRFHKLSLGGVCNTLRAGTASDRGAFTAPRPIHPVYPRCISVREAARLTSYPDWFRFHRTIWHGFRQIGNSVPPLLGRIVAKAVLEALGDSPQRPNHSVTVGSSYLSRFDMTQAANYFGLDWHPVPPRKRVHFLIRR